MEKIIRIEHSKVLQEQWNDLQFIGRLALRIQEVQTFLAEPNSTEMFSIHEAGHAIYWEKLGSTVRHVGPTLQYIPEFNKWHFYPIATIPTPSPVLLKANYQNLLAIAKGATAGGEFVRILGKEPSEADEGTAEDRSRFHKMCEMLRENAMEQNRFLGFNEKQIWDNGAVGVRSDLENAEFKLEARERAGRIKRDWFA